MRVITHYDEIAPRKERYRVLRAKDEISGNTRDVNGRTIVGLWETLASFPTEREANAFGRGFYGGCLDQGYRL